MLLELASWVQAGRGVALRSGGQEVSAVGLNKEEEFAVAEKMERDIRRDGRAVFGKTRINSKCQASCRNRSSRSISFS